jgi:hypothetical protein
MINTSEKISAQIRIQTIKVGWLKRSYQFLDGDKTIGQLDFANSFHKTATANVLGKEFSIRRKGFWTHYLEITSTSYQPYNMVINVNWRSKIKINDFNGTPYVFKSTSIWKNKWAWFDRYERPLVEIRSRVLTRKNRGLVEIKFPEMKDVLFWMFVSWFVILCAESDAASASS